MALDPPIRLAYHPAVALESSFHSVASVLVGLAKRHGLQAKLLEHKLIRNWPAIVGEPVASHTRPGQIRFKKLSLIVENSLWAQHLTFFKPALIAQINRVAGSPVITDVILRVGSVDPSGDRPGTPRQGLSTPLSHEQSSPALEPSPLLKEEINAHISAVADPELRTKLAEVIEHALAQAHAPFNK